MKVSDKARAWFIGGCLVMVLLILGVVIFDEGREATFFPDGRARVWPVTPVVVEMSPSVRQAWGPQIRDAIARINEEVDCTVLDTSGAPANVRIITPLDDSPCANAGTEIGDDSGAITHVCAKGTTDIVTWKLVHVRQAYLAIKHDLLHALGLAHDNGGLMAPMLPDWAWEELDVPGEMMSRKDILALRDRYCQ